MPVFAGIATFFGARHGAAKRMTWLIMCDPRLQVGFMAFIVGIRAF
jgi:hypothetical protein